MCMLLKLNYAKFGVSNLFLSKGIEEKPLGVGSARTPLVQEGLMVNYCQFQFFLGMILRMHSD